MLNNATTLGDNNSMSTDDIDLPRRHPQVRHMMIRALLLILSLALVPAAASAACYADYKAKRDAPLRLHYGVIEIDISPCTMSDRVTAVVAERLSAADWQLLQVQSVFGNGGLGERKKDAGRYFLRF